MHYIDIQYKKIVHQINCIILFIIIQASYIVESKANQLNVENDSVEVNAENVENDSVEVAAMCPGPQCRLRPSAESGEMLVLHLVHFLSK